MSEDGQNGASSDKLSSKNTKQDLLDVSNQSPRSESAQNSNAGGGAGNLHFDIEDVDQEKKVPVYMISMNSPLKLLWSLMIFSLVIYTAIYMPIRIAFMSEQKVTHSQTIFDVTTDIIFIVDICLNFLMIDEDQNGELIVNKKKIATRYLKSWFAIDLLSSLPVSLIMFIIDLESDELVSFRIIKLAKMARLYRLLTLFKLFRLFKNHRILEIAVQYFNLTPDTKQIIFSLVRMIFLLHVVGCIYAIAA